jgi:hypothetical protein
VGIFDRMGRGWNLAMQSFAVLHDHPSLLVFPILSTISFILLVVTFMTGFGEHFTPEALKQFDDVTVFGLLYLYYFINSFIIIFFNLALTHCVLKITQGQEAGVADGLAYSLSRITSVVIWAAISATVGIILKMMTRRRNVLGNIAASILGMIWSLATFFVLPVLAAENLSVPAAIGRSSSLFKETWGERTGAAFSFGFIGFVIFMAVAIVLAAIFMATDWVEAFIVSLFLLGSLMSCVMSTAQTVFMVNVYKYATAKTKTGEYDDLFE